MRKYKLTVVIPVFNTESYLPETLECVRNQTIGFENIQLLLLNDASMDHSSEICQRFLDKHENNVKYRELPVNRGVSYVKNIGLEMAEGKYISFWDSDDLWSLEAMEKAVAFLDDHEEEIDLVSANIEFFEKETGKHPTNFKLEESRVIDIHTEYDKIRSAGAATVMKSDVAKEYRFDEEQEYAEDAKFINSIILRKQKYGMLSDVTYYYRKRFSADSASQTYTRSKGYYLRDLTHLYEGLSKESIRQCGRIVPMVQYYLAYALGYRFTEETVVLNQKERSEYNIMLKNVLSDIEDKYISEITNVDSKAKCKMLAFKHGMEIQGYLNEWQQRENDVDDLYRQLQRAKMNYNVLKNWFELKQQNQSIVNYFQAKGYQKIAIYGMSDIGRYLHQELYSSQVEVAYAIDRRAEQLDLPLKILKIEDNLPPVDAIIVTAVYFFDQIKELLRDKVDCQIISIKDILQDCDSKKACGGRDGQNFCSGSSL